MQRKNLKSCQTQESVNIFKIRRMDKGERDGVEGVKMQRRRRWGAGGEDAEGRRKWEWCVGEGNLREGEV